MVKPRVNMWLLIAKPSKLWDDHMHNYGYFAHMTVKVKNWPGNHQQDLQGFMTADSLALLPTNIVTAVY